MSPRAQLERYKAKMDRTCHILECAIENGVDHFFRCGIYPCKPHYDVGIYDKRMLYW